MLRATRHPTWTPSAPSHVRRAQDVPNPGILDWASPDLDHLFIRISVCPTATFLHVAPLPSSQRALQPPHVPRRAATWKYRRQNASKSHRTEASRTGTDSWKAAKGGGDLSRPSDYLEGEETDHAWWGNYCTSSRCNSNEPIQAPAHDASSLRPSLACTMPRGKGHGNPQASWHT